MRDVEIIESAGAAEACLDPMRSRLLAALREPGSASTLAQRTGLQRQKINYHLRALERAGVVELVEERRRGNMTERVVQATAASYVISPAALAELAPDPAARPDQLSAHWMLAIAARLVREVGTLLSRATAAGRPLATLTIDAELRFATAADRAGFAAELSETLAALVTKYDSAATATARPHRLIVALHPSITAAGDAAALTPSTTTAITANQRRPR